MYEYIASEHVHFAHTYGVCAGVNEILKRHIFTSAYTHTHTYYNISKYISNFIMKIYKNKDFLKFSNKLLTYYIYVYVFLYLFSIRCE